MRIGPVFPTRAQTDEFRWSSGEARRRLVHGFDSRNASSRSFNLIRSKLVALQRDRGWRMLGVLRRGTIKDIFGIDAEEGIVSYLEQAEPRNVLAGFMPQGQELIIIPSVAGPVHSAELLASERASALFRAMRNSDERNYFICDLPPVFANDDAAIIMEALDGYMIVAQDGKTTRREVAATVEMLGHERLAGVVLNKYRGGMVSEGYGIEDRYASEYYAAREADED